MAIALGLDKLGPTVALELLLELDGVLDLLELEQNNLVIKVAVSVDVSKDAVGLLDAALGNHPSRRLRDEPDKAQLEDGGESLNEGRHTPCPVVVDVVRAEGQPRGNEGTDVPGCVVDGGESGAVLRVDELSDEQRRGTVGNGDTESEEETGCDEHLDVDGDGLENHTDDHDDAADADTSAATEDISGVRDEWDSDEGTDGPALEC